MSTLYAGCWVGEFGWELFCWQGHIRQKARKYNNCVVACRSGHEVLYEDFAKVISCDIPSENTDMWMCQGYKEMTFEQIFDTPQIKNDWIKPQYPIVRYDHQHKLDHQFPFARFKEQEFIQYGSSHSKGYDIIIHARSKDGKGRNRNWSEKKWEQLVSCLERYSIACIGTKRNSDYIAGDDLRGISLRSLCNILASSKVIVGPSSGPIHLAALCGCPQVVWFGDPYSQSNEIRYRKDWNPFKTKNEIIFNKRWDVPPKDVLDRVKKFLK